MKRFLLSILFLVLVVDAFPQLLTLQGKIINELNGQPIAGAAVKVSNTIFNTSASANGTFTIQLLKRHSLTLLITHVAYEPLIKSIRPEKADTIFLELKLKEKNNLLAEVPVYAISKPETLVGKPNYSIYDFDFIDDKLILLTAEKSLSKAEIKLSDYQGTIYNSFTLPKSAGVAEKFFHDYEGYPDLICKDSIFRIDVLNTELNVSTIPFGQFKKNLVPIVDTNANNYYLTNAWDNYPAINYYFLKENDTVATLLQKIENEDLIKLYNLEYYYLPPRMQLEVRRIADAYKTDKHIIAALVSGFTKSLYYDPIYAPLFIFKDTICIFNHYNDHLYHYNKNNELIDSVKINYHHPKNWREWKKQLYADEINNKLYALFSKDSHNYLKEINYQTGQSVLTYKLKHHSAERIKIRDGYVYYVYRPFESTQEKFLYREKIN